jgi:short-subunit dehydrogenase
MSELERKIVVITGATGGLGAEMVKAFLKEGSHLILTDLYQSALETIYKEVEFIRPGKILGRIALDLTQPNSPEELAQFVRSFGSPDILVNNAGIATFGKFSDTPREKWEKIMELNLLAPMKITHKMLPLMIPRKSGHIVNISSVAGILASPGLVAYSTSKFGIRSFGEALHAELRELGIKVTNLYPFFTRTAILDSEQFGVKNKKSLPDFLLSEPEEVIKELIFGIKHDHLHVFPGIIAKSLDIFSKLTPWLFQDMAKGVMY